MALQGQAEILCALGRRIKVLRNSLGLSQAQLADSAGMSQRYLSEVESGKRNVSITFLGVLAEKLSMPLSELVQPEEEMTRQEAMKSLYERLDKLSVGELLFLNRMIRIFEAGRRT